MNKTGLILVLSLVAFLCSCSVENSKLEKLESGNGIYIYSGLESEAWEHVSSGYRKSESCESNEFYIDTMNNCVIGIDVDSQISNGFVVHRKLVNKVEGKKLYQLLISMPDGSPIENG